MFKELSEFEKSCDGTAFEIKQNGLKECSAHPAEKP